MVAHFKVSAGRTPVYEITRKNVESLGLLDIAQNIAAKRGFL
jgi:hypothetical protein